MSYEAAFNSGSEIVLDSPLGEVNLFILGGAPSQAVDLTFVLDGSYSFGDTSISAGSFPAGSKLTIILVNGFDGQATGGSGGRGEDIIYNDTLDIYSFFPPVNGTAGGIVYNANGVDTDIICVRLVGAMVALIILALLQITHLEMVVTVVMVARLVLVVTLVELLMEGHCLVTLALTGKLTARVQAGG